MSMNNKYMRHISSEEFPKDILDQFIKEEQESNFYIIEDKEEDMLGICQTIDSDSEKTIEYIEVNKDYPYKYLGQGFIATPGEEALKNNQSNLSVCNPLTNTLNFYVKNAVFNLTKEIS